MQLKNTKLVDFDGVVLKDGNIELTVAKILVNCCMMPAPQNEQYTEAQVVSRYDLGIQFNKLAVDQIIDITVEQAAMLKTDVLRGYPPILAGQLIYALEGKN